MIVLKNASKQYKGITINNDSGIYLWIKNLVRLTGNKAAAVLAVDNISFSVDKGEVLGIYGSNGAGKTTLIKLLSGLLYPSAGTVTVNGQTGSRQIKNSVSYISTNGWMGLEWQLTARENLLLYGSMFGLSGKALDRASDEVLETVGMSEAKGKYISQLSAGMRQKVTIARGLLLDRPVIFYDEPCVSLDIESAKKLRELIRADALQKKRTAIIASHNDEDLSVCDRILMLSHGRIIAAGTHEELAAPFANKKIIEIKMQRQNQKITFNKISGVENIAYRDIESYRDLLSVKISVRKDEFIMDELVDFLIENNIAIYSIKDINISLYEIYEYHLARNRIGDENAI